MAMDWVALVLSPMISELAKYVLRIKDQSFRQTATRLVVAWIAGGLVYYRQGRYDIALATYIGTTSWAAIAYMAERAQWNIITMRWFVKGVVGGLLSIEREFRRKGNTVIADMIKDRYSFVLGIFGDKKELLDLYDFESGEEE